MLPKGALSPYTQRGNLQLCSQSRSLLICFGAVFARVSRSVKGSLLAILYRCGLEPGVYPSSVPNSSATTAAIFRCTKLAASSALGSGQLAVLWAASSAMGSLQCRGHYKLPKALQVFLRIFSTFVIICPSCHAS